MYSTATALVQHGAPRMNWADLSEIAGHGQHNSGTDAIWSWFSGSELVWVPTDIAYGLVFGQNAGGKQIETAKPIKASMMDTKPLERAAKDRKETSHLLSSQDQEFHQQMLRKLALHLAAQPENESPQFEESRQSSVAVQNECLDAQATPQRHEEPQGIRTPESPSDVADLLAELLNESKTSEEDKATGSSRTWQEAVGGVANFKGGGKDEHDEIADEASCQCVCVPMYILSGLLGNIAPGQNTGNKADRRKGANNLRSQDQELHQEMLRKLALHLAAQPDSLQQPAPSQVVHPRIGSEDTIGTRASKQGKRPKEAKAGKQSRFPFNQRQGRPQQQEFHQEILQKLALHLAAQPDTLSESASSTVQCQGATKSLISLAECPEEASLELVGDPSEIGEDQTHCDSLIADLEPPFDNVRAVRAAKIMKWLLLAASKLSLKRSGSRVVQQAIDVASAQQRDQLAEALLQDAMDLMISPHANHALAKLIEVMPPAHSVRIAEVMRGKASTVARHQFGSRILERLMEHCDEDQTGFLLDELVEDLEPLARHQFGNFVVQHLLEHSRADRKNACVQKLLPHVLQHATHKTACNVVQRMLEHADLSWQARISDAFLAGEGDTSLETIAATRYGSFVVQSLVDKLHPRIDALKARVKAARPQLQESGFSRRKIVEFFGEAFFHD